MAHFNIFPYNSLFLLIDVQEAFVKAIPSIDPDDPACGKQCEILCKVSEILDMPTIISQQYPKGLGQSLPTYTSNKQAQIFDKLHFSCCDDEVLKNALADSQRDTIIIAGIEAHVCVLSTCSDLINRGYNVIVASDAIASRNPEHAESARQCMRQLGALVLPTESIVLRLQRLAGTDSFKALSKLIR